MDPIYILLFYRILIVVSGIICIYFGYRLFFVVKQKQGEFKLKTGDDMEVSLSDFAPGVLFALFGAGILIFSVLNSVSIEPVTVGGDLTGYHGTAIIRN